VFVWARRLPFLRLGQVAYSPLERIDAMPLPAFERLASGFAKLSREPGAVQRALDDALEGHRGNLVNLPAQLGSSHFPLLRYPLLARDSRERDALVARLDKSGLGASAFYGRALAEIPGLPSLDRTRTPEAVRFAARLLTLPVHSDVRMRDVETMKSVLRAT
jgi:dTDP-4-amino-4,6-dideoxygalactose transaminase